MFNFEETQEQTQIADYNAYLQLKALRYSNRDIARHMSYTLQQLINLTTKFTVTEEI